jgi:aconitate hydratase
MAVEPIIIFEKTQRHLPGRTAVFVKPLAVTEYELFFSVPLLQILVIRAADYDKIKLGDMLELPEVKAEIAAGKSVTVVNTTNGESFKADCELSDRTRAIIIAGGLLDYTKENS